MNKIVLFFMVVATMLLAVACDPVDDRESPDRLLTESEIDFTVTQNPAGSNIVTLESKTAQIIPYFDWGTGFTNKAKSEQYFPFAGKYTVTYTAFAAGGGVSKSKEFTVAQNDPVYFEHPAWKILSGTGDAGKVWVWASDIPKSDFEGRIWGNGGYKNIPAGPGWWGHTATSTTEIDAKAEMYFDLKGAAHFKHTSGTTVSSGSYDMKLDKANQVYTDDNRLWAIGNITFSGATIPHGISPNEGNKAVYKFDIVTLTEDELVLCYNTPGGGEGWYWRFKRKGFNY